MATKKFDMERAQQLLVSYKKGFKLTKVQFISDLMRTQSYFGNKSIVGNELLLTKKYRRETVEQVLADMDYIIKNYDISGQLALITFTEKEG